MWWGFTQFHPTMKIRMEVSQKLKAKERADPAMAFLDDYPKDSKAIRQRHLHINAYCSTAHHS